MAQNSSEKTKMEEIVTSTATNTHLKIKKDPGILRLHQKRRKFLQSSSKNKV
jgi:hypothetical protein